MRCVRRCSVVRTVSRWAWSGSALVAEARNNGPCADSWKRTSARPAAAAREPPSPSACAASRKAWRSTEKLRSKHSVIRSSLLSWW